MRAETATVTTGFRLNVSERKYTEGILNLTPDSFFVKWAHDFPLHVFQWKPARVGQSARMKNEYRAPQQGRHLLQD